MDGEAFGGSHPANTHKERDQQYHDKREAQGADVRLQMFDFIFKAAHGFESFLRFLPGGLEDIGDAGSIRDVMGIWDSGTTFFGYRIPFLKASDFPPAGTSDQVIPA